MCFGNAWLVCIHIVYPVLYVLYTLHAYNVCCFMFNIIPTEDKKQIRQEAESIAKTMNLSVVRLCFQVG